MIKYNVKRGPAKYFDSEEEIEITRYISEIVKSDKLRVLNYNICGDHIHLIIVCEEIARDSIVRKLKSETARKFNIAHGYTISEIDTRQGGKPPCSNRNRGDSQTQLWAQKFNCSYIETEEKLIKAFEYVKNNRNKHGLPDNPNLSAIIDKMLTDYDKAFEQN